MTSTSCAILVGDLGAKSVNDGMLGKKIVGQQQFGLVIQSSRKDSASRA